MDEKRNFRFPSGPDGPSGGLRLGGLFTPGVKVLLAIFAATCALSHLPVIGPFVYHYLLLRPALALGPMPWQLLTGPFIVTDLIQLLFTGFLLFSIGGTVEKTLGTRRFLRFLALTSVLSALVAAAAGLLFPVTRYEVVVLEAAPLFMALLSSFARLFGHQQMTIWGGGQPMSGRVVSFFFIGLSLLMFAFQQHWLGLIAAATGAGSGYAFGGLGRFSPVAELQHSYRQWRARVKRRQYKVIDGGLLVHPDRQGGRSSGLSGGASGGRSSGGPSGGPSSDKRWIN